MHIHLKRASFFSWKRTPSPAASPTPPGRPPVLAVPPLLRAPSGFQLRSPSPVDGLPAMVREAFHIIPLQSVDGTRRYGFFPKKLAPVNEMGHGELHLEIEKSKKERCVSLAFSSPWHPALSGPSLPMRLDRKSILEAIRQHAFQWGYSAVFDSRVKVVGMELDSPLMDEPFVINRCAHLWDEGHFGMTFYLECGLRDLDPIDMELAWHTRFDRLLGGRVRFQVLEAPHGTRPVTIEVALNTAAVRVLPLSQPHLSKVQPKLTATGFPV